MQPFLRYLRETPAWPIQTGLLSGVLYGLAWAVFPVETGWLSWIAWVPLLLRIRRVRSFWEHGWITLPTSLVVIPLICWWTSELSVWALPTVWLTQAPLVGLPLLLLYPLQKRMGWRRTLVLLPLFWTFWAWTWLAICTFDLDLSSLSPTPSTLRGINRFADLMGGWVLIAWTIGFNVVLARNIDQTEIKPIGQLVRRLVIASGLWLSVPLLVGWLGSSGQSFVLHHPNCFPIGCGLLWVVSVVHQTNTHNRTTRRVARFSPTRTRNR